jgi:hypothetical protein
LYETSPAAAQSIPRTVDQYSNNAVEQTYYANDSYTSTSVDALSDRFQAANISYTDYTTSHSALPYQASSSSGEPLVNLNIVTLIIEVRSTGYEGTQPMNMPVSPARSIPSGNRTYSASAPADTYMSRVEANSTDRESGRSHIPASSTQGLKVTGYFPEDSPGFISSPYANDSAYRRAPTDESTYSNTLKEGSPYYAYNQPNAGEFLTSACRFTLIREGDTRLGGEVEQGSGVVTPKEIHKAIKGTRGTEEPLNPSMLRLA